MTMTKKTITECVIQAKRETYYPLQKKALVILAADTGMRLSELLQLQWDQFIVFDKHVEILVREQRFSISKELYNNLLKFKKEESKVFHSLNSKTISDMMKRISNVLGYIYDFQSIRKFSIEHKQNMKRSEA